MKKIIYNTKTKKFLISILIVMILLDFMMPNVVFASTTTIEHTDYDFSYADWINLQNDEKYGEFIKDYGIEKYEEDLKEKTLKAVREVIYAKENIEDSNKAKELAENLLSTSPDGIMINGSLEVGTNFIGWTVCKFEIKESKDKNGNEHQEVALTEKGHDNKTEQTMKYKELLEWSGKSADALDEEIIQLIIDEYFVGVETVDGSTPEEVSATILELNKETIEFKVQGNKDDYTIVSFEVPGKDEYDLKIEAGRELGIRTSEDDKYDASLGGILLSPIFYLVNFFTDAITSNLGRIMTGQGVSAISGIGILTNTKPNLGYTKSDSIEVDIHSFLLSSLGALSYQYPNITYTPEEIFAGKIDLLSIDFISGKNYSGAENTDSDWTSIRKVISQWYKVLRMIAIVGLLSVLIYTGIKIMISANAKDKAKYKEWIINWFIAVAILFSMHYIMSFIIAVTGEINSMLSGATQGIKVELVNAGEPVMKNGEQDTFVTNLMGLVRFMIQSEDFYIKVGYEVMYIALLVYTIKFTLIYLKRVLNMAFLTLIAPIVALTYPIDKLNDGQAQGFNMWLKEYIFNALLQPMHYIMYYILVGSAVSIAASNPIYGIVVLMFMTEAEKLLKKIFGFDKAGGGTVGGMTGAFAAGAIASSVKDIARMSKLPGGNAGKGGSGTEKSDVFDNLKATKDDTSMSSFLNEASSGGNSTAGTGAGAGTGTGTEGAGRSAADDTSEQDSARQKMLDADYEDSFGTSDYDGERMNALEQDANSEENQDHERSWDEYKQELESLGFEGEELDEAMAAAGYTEADELRQKLANGEINEYDLNDKQRKLLGMPPSDPERYSTPQPSQTPIRDMAKKVKNSRQYKGLANVGKTLAKPVWDFEKGKAYNGKRLARNIARGALGVGIGVTAAAVQAGISITDGKYNPMEGIGTFAAGYAGAGQIFKGAESLGAVYNEGAYAGDKEAQMKRAKAKYGDRDDVIAYNKKNYAGREKEMMERQRDNWLEYGYYNPKDMKSGIKYADAYIKNKYGDNFKNLSAEEQKRITKEADTRAIQTMRFRKTLEGQGQSQAIYDEEKRKKYIEMMVKKEVTDPNATAADKERVRNKYRNAFNAVIEYDDAQ